jgi:hypothetical protein
MSGDDVYSGGTDQKSDDVGFEIRAMPTETKGVQKVLRNYLRRRLDAGYSYVTADDIRRDLDWEPMPQKIGSNLRVLQDNGVVEKWNDGTPATYKITLDGDRNE